MNVNLLLTIIYIILIIITIVLISIIIWKKFYNKSSAPTPPPHSNTCNPPCDDGKICIQKNGTYICEKPAPPPHSNTCNPPCDDGKICIQKNGKYTCETTVPPHSTTCNPPCDNGKVCIQKNGKYTCETPTPPPSSGKWDGWATTTQFGSGDGPWGNQSGYQIDLKQVNNPSKNRMGAAVPWRILCKEWGTKNEQAKSTVESAQGKNTDNSCWLIQPISKYPGEVKGSTDDMFDKDYLNSMCSGSDCIDINDDDIVAKDDKGNPYPPYLIVPFEGCGGNCKNVPDCMNSCAAAGNNMLAATECDFGKTLGDACDGMKVLWDNGKWDWNDNISNDFLKYSYPYGVNPQNDWGKDTSKTPGILNWCSGQNMHFDIALTNPYWENLGMGNIAQTNAPSNILVRYKRVPCNIAGNFDPNPVGGGGGGGSYVACPSGSWDCGGLDCTNCTSGKVLKPGDPNWKNSEKAKHSCCVNK